MKHSKKFLALTLAICLFLSMPMALNVSATGKADATDFTLAQAVVVPESWGVSTSVAPAGKSILPYFTGGGIGNVYDTSTTTNNSAGTSLGMTDPASTLYTGIAVVIVAKGTNWAYGNASNAAMHWSCSMDVNEAVSTGPNNYFAKLTGSMDASKVPNSLTDAQKAKYTSAIDTLDEIFMLAEDMGAEVQFRMWERGNYCTQNGIVESYYNANTKVQLTGTCKVNDGGYYNEKETDTYDCATVKLSRVGVDTLDFLKAEFIEDENSLKLTFREGLSYGGRGNGATFAGLAVINGKGQIMHYSADGGYKTAKEVTDGSLTGYTALKKNTGMSFEQVVSNGSAYAVSKCFLNDAQLQTYREMLAHVQALNKADAQGGYQVSYILEDKTVVKKRGESVNNHYVDGAWGTNGRPLYANYCDKTLGVVDMAAQPIVSVATDPANDKPLTVTGVFINPNNDNQVVLTFSEPIRYSWTGLDVRLYPVDENMDSVINKEYPTGTYWTVKDLSRYGSVGNQLVGTLKVPDSEDNQSFKSAVNHSNKNWPGKTLKIAIWEGSQLGIPSNGHVDTIFSKDGTKKLVANKVAAQDVALVDITQETIAVEKIQIINDTTIRVVWTDAIAEGLYRPEATSWKSIRITNDKFELQKDNNGAWMQYGGTWAPTEDASVWYFTLSGMTFSKIASMIGVGGDYEGLKMTFAIEQVHKNEDTGEEFGNLTDLVDNITSPDGVRPVVATNNEATSWWDGSYTELDMTPTPTAFTRISDTQARIVLPFAGSYAGGALTTDNGLTSTAIEAEEGNDCAYTVTFPAGLSAATTVTVPAGVFTSPMGANKEVTLTEALASFEDGVATVTLDEATTYTFTNADTGREITVDGNSDLRVVCAEKERNLYTILAGDAYLDLTVGAPKAVDYPVYYQIVPRAHDRYMIYATQEMAVSDTDKGTTAEATLALTPAANINAGWYLTEAGQTKPIRLLPIGDSITYGTNPDGYSHGWRDSLSQMLNEYMEVPVVFVGSKVSLTVGVDSDMLYRHEGNPGWTVKDHPRTNNTPLNGIYDLVPGLVSKYDPDVVCMMIGINDMSVYVSGGMTDDERDEMKGDYRDLVEALAVNMDSGDTIFCSRLTPMTDDHSLNRHHIAETFNDEWDFNSWIDEFAAAGLPVSLNDNYAALAGKTNVVSSDGIHLNANGDSYVAQAYFNSFVREYDANGIKYQAVEEFCEDLSQATAGETVVLEGNFDLSDREGVSVPAGVTLDLNGHTLTAKAVAAVTSTSAIIDSSNGQGGIKVAKDKLLFVGANTQLPLYDAAFGGYRFFTFESEYLQKDGETSNSTMFGMHLELSEQALALLADKESAGVDMIFRVESDVLVEPIDWVVRAQTLADYAQKQAADPDGFWVVVLTISGLDTLPEDTTLTVTASMVSTTTAVLGTSALDYTR